VIKKLNSKVKISFYSTINIYFLFPDIKRCW